MQWEKLMDDLAKMLSDLPGSAAILCVDDERIILSSLQEQLRYNFPKLTIEVAESGEEALEVLGEMLETSTQVPIVISDQLMPGMRGEELLEMVHGLSPNTLNVLLTGQATADSVGAAVNRANLYRYIGKPWAENDLVLTVREALRAWGQAREIRRKDLELRETHEASMRFVPREFLRALQKERLTDVREGHAIEANMQVLFADMRSFSIHAADLGAKQAFDLLNEYINILDTEIRSSGGFIAGLEGDGILALFPGRPLEAVAAGIQAHHKLLERARTADSGPIIDMGLAVHSGSLVMGTVGNSERLKCDVIGDPVNFCARLESLTREFDTPMLVSEDVARSLDGQMSLRRIPGVLIKGRTGVSTIYEVLDALPADLRSNRESTLAQFDESMNAREAGNAQLSSEILEKICIQNPNDSPSKILLAQSRGG